MPSTLVYPPCPRGNVAAHETAQEFPASDYSGPNRIRYGTIFLINYRSVRFDAQFFKFSRSSLSEFAFARWPWERQQR